jgi:hypothetical protein
MFVLCYVWFSIGLKSLSKTFKSVKGNLKVEYVSKVFEGPRKADFMCLKGPQNNLKGFEELRPYMFTSGQPVITLLRAKDATEVFWNLCC